MPSKDRPDMILRSPMIDLLLPVAFMALALIAALSFARAGWPNGVGLCLTGLIGGLLWMREVLRLVFGQTEGEDG
jgi:hypothetical protein